jgi:hypothetical protein
MLIPEAFSNYTYAKREEHGEHRSHTEDTEVY